MGPGIFPETTVGKHNPRCHLQMPTEALSWKKEAICEHGPEAPSCPVGQGSFKMHCFKVEECSMIRRVKFDILVGNHGRRVLRPKEEGDLPACYQHSVQKPAPLMVWGCIWYGQLACFGRHYECWKVYKGFRATYAPLQIMFISAGQCKTTLQLSQQHGFVVEEPGCWIGLPAVQIFHL